MATGLLICHKSSGFSGTKAESVGLLSCCPTSIAGSTRCPPSAPLFSVSVLESCAESTGGTLSGGMGLPHGVLPWARGWLGKWAAS